MADAIRIGAVCTVADGNHATEEQLLGAELARDDTRARWGTGAPDLELVERRVPDDVAAAERAAVELVEREGCGAVMGMSSVPVSARLAAWCEDHGRLFLAANNNPVVRAGRRFAFGIGVPSEVTGQATARALAEVLGAKRVFLIHRPGEFQTYAARCAADAMAERGLVVEPGEIGDEPANVALVGRIQDWKPDAVCFFAGSELDEPAAFMKLAQARGGLPPTLLSRSMLCSEFARTCGDAADGHYFIDMFLRNERASEQERVLTRALAAHDASEVVTANHGFGWDGLQLVAEAVRSGGAAPEAQARYIEGLRQYPGVTGILTFGPDDHNGHFHADPTTIARLVQGRFVPYHALAR